MDPWINGRMALWIMDLRNYGFVAVRSLIQVWDAGLVNVLTCGANGVDWFCDLLHLR